LAWTQLLCLDRHPLFRGTAWAGTPRAAVKLIPADKLR
jgi:hypothetical protein